MPNPRAFFTTSSSTCTVTSAERRRRHDQLPRRRRDAAAHRALDGGLDGHVNGKAAPITTVDGVYQQVALPRALDRHLPFFPPHERYAISLGLLGGLFLVGSW